MKSFALCALFVVMPATAFAVEFEFVGINYFAAVFQIDPNTGEGVQIRPQSGFFERTNSMARDAAGNIFSFGAPNRLVALDPFTGAVTSTTFLNIPEFDCRGLACAPDGTIFAIREQTRDFAFDRLYTLDRNSGVATLIGSSGLSGIQALEFSLDDRLYGWDVGLNGVGDSGLIEIDPTTGIATDVSPLFDDTLPGKIQTLAFGPDGVLYGAGDSLYRIGIQTGEQFLIGSGGYYDLRGLAVVPEPSTFALLAIGGIFLNRTRRRVN